VYELSSINQIKINILTYLVMRKIYKLLIPAFIAVVLCSACEDPMEEMAIEDVAQETFSEMPPKSKIKLPPGYEPAADSDTGQ
jgi:hypothetical protein